MNAFNEYSASELIYLFMDGKADTQQRKYLFSSLAADNRLQSEFQDALNIRSAFDADKKDMIPSAALTNSVFAAAGFSSPFAQPAANAPQQAPDTPISPVAGSGFFNKLVNFSNPFFTATLSTLSTAIVFLLLLNPYLLTNADNLNKTNNSQLNLINKTNKGIPVVTSTESTENTTKDIKNKKETIRYIVVHDKADQTINFEQQEAQNTGSLTAFNEVAEPKSKITNINTAGIFNHKNRMHSETLSLSKVNMDLPEPEITGYKDARLSFEFKGFSNLVYFPKREITPLKENFWNNFNVAGFWKLDENCYIGLEGGQESFPMYAFDSVVKTVPVVYDRNGRKVTIYENQTEWIARNEPKIIWAGGKFRYAFNCIEFLHNVRPFVSATAGFSNLGFLTKSSAGLYYNPENIFSFSLGLEYSVLFYKMLPDIKESGIASKLGVYFTMGLNIK